MVEIESLISVVDISDYILNEYVPAKALVCNLEVVFSPTAQSSDSQQQMSCGQMNCGEALKFPFALNAGRPIAVPIKRSKELVLADEATQTKRVVELTLDTTPLGLDFDYVPGDTIAILPSNAASIVTALLQRLDLEQQADTMCEVKLSLSCAKKSAKVPAHIPPNTTPRELFTHCLQLNGVLQKQFLSALAACTSDVKERSFLACLSSKQGSANYNAFVLEQGLRLLDILELCTTCKPTLALLAEHLPRLLPRPYSIANSPLECAQELRIIYSVLARTAGVTTSMLEARAKQAQTTKSDLLIYPRTINAFRYTAQDVASNQILIAVGTGLAPFLGFLAHKQQHQKPWGQTWLYVGARTPQAMLKADTLLEWQQTAVLQRLRMCHSRGPAPAAKYVQDLLVEDATELVELLLQPATVLYVCADGAKISQSISAALRQCLQLALSLEESAAMQQLQDWRKAGKYREDVWL